jgi:hypothetical protein
MKVETNKKNRKEIGLELRRTHFGLGNDSNLINSNFKFRFELPFSI